LPKERSGGSFGNKKRISKVPSYEAMKIKDLIKCYLELIDEHRSWLNLFGKHRLDNWEKLLQNNVEAAICEAATRRLLSKHRVKIEPYEDPSSGGPDFSCIKDDERFYAEATCVIQEKAMRKTGLTDGSQYTFKPLTKVVMDEIRNKTTQCSNLNTACILVIGTLHPQIGHICFSKDFAEHVLTATPKIGTQWDNEKKRATDKLCKITELHNSSFVKSKKAKANEIEEARRTISALLLCSFGVKLPRAIGVLHPKPNHFFRLAEGYQDGQFQVEWI